MSASKVQRRVQTAGRVGWSLRSPCTISEVAKSYGLVPQTVGNWVNKWRKTHSGIEGEEMTAAQLAEYKKIKAELREARTGDRFLEKSGGLLRAGISIKTRYAYIHRQGRQPPRNLCDVPLPGWCRIQAITPGVTGVCQTSRKAS